LKLFSADIATRILRPERNFDRLPQVALSNGSVMLASGLGIFCIGDIAI